MAEQSNILDPILNLTRAMSSLRAMTDPKGISEVSKSVTRDDVREKNNLTPNEQSRLRESATIIGKVLKIGAFKEGPEATRLGDLTPNADKIKAVPTAIRDKVQPMKENSNSLLDSLLGLLGLGSLALLWEKARTWLLGKLTKFVFTPIKNLMKWVGGKIWGAIKWVGSKIWGGLKWLGNRISKIVSGLIGKIKNSKFYKGLMSVVKSVSTGIKNLWDDALKGIKGFVDNLVKGITNLKEGALNLVKKIPGYDLVKKGLEKTAQVGKAAGSAVVRGAKAAGGVVKNVADDALESAVKLGKGQLTKILGGFLGKGVKVIGGALKRMPVIGPLIEGLFAASDIKGYNADYSQGKITLDELQNKIGRRIITAITGAGGAVIGAGLGSVIGPVGTIIGGIGGDILGRWLGGLFVDKIMSPDMVKKLGSFFQADQTNTTDGKNLNSILDQGEMQDFLVRNGKVYKFNTKDEVLGMKTGGAIDNLMTGITKGLARDNSIIRDASIAQVNKLDELIYLMTEFLKKPTASSFVPVGVGTGSYTPFRVSDTRSKYNNQTLITP